MTLPPIDPAARFAVPVTGPTYRRSARTLAVILVVLLLAYGARVIATAGFGATGWAVLAAGALGLALTGWSVLAGRTTIDAAGIRQTGFPGRAFRWNEIAHARTLRMPLTSRLLISTGTGPLRAVHAGNAGLDAAFSEIGDWYRRRA